MKKAYKIPSQTSDLKTPLCYFKHSNLQLIMIVAFKMKMAKVVVLIKKL